VISFAMNKTTVVGMMGALGVCALSMPAFAGEEVSTDGKKTVVEPAAHERQWGSITLGVKSSSDLTSGYLDTITPFWTTPTTMLALNTRATYDNRDQSLNSYGLIARAMLPDQNLIFGVNGYYDAVHSQFGSDFDQAGFGAEVLTHWVDARFNYYLPEDTRYEIGRSTSVKSDKRIGPIFPVRTSSTNLALQQTTTRTEKRKTVKRFDEALQGWNAEVGFLLPGLDQYMEVRAFAGAYGYQNPFGSDYVGFKARVEARIVPAITANVEYWDDANLMGGHWTGELRVTVPFSIFNLASGRNPFEGAAEAFTFRKRDFSERMGDLVLRSHREFSTSGVPSGGQPRPTTDSTGETNTVGNVTLQPKPKVVVQPPT